MTEIDTQGLIDLKQKVITSQSHVPSHSLDWNIYQGQIDLLEQVEALVKGDYVTQNKLGKTSVNVAGKTVGEQG